MGFARNDDIGKLIIRLMVSVLILFHGIGKVLDPSALGSIQDHLTDAGLPEFVAYGVYLGEVVGPLMILFGMRCRIGGLLVVINMLFALGLVHMDILFALTDHGYWAIQTQLFFLLSGLSVVFLGSGRFAFRPD